MGHFSHLDLIVLFFFFGLLASAVRVPVRIPESVFQFLSIYLLLAIGYKGGQQVAHAQELSGLSATLAIALGSCCVIPIVVFQLAKKAFGLANGAALAATYGSVSAVTFIVAQSYLHSEAVIFSGYMVAVMAIMEAPAIAISLFLYDRGLKKPSSQGHSWIRASFGHKSIVLLLGSFFIGLVMDEKGSASLKPILVDGFKGFLAIYLIDLGSQAAHEMRILWNQKLRSLAFAILLPVVFGSFTLLAAWAVGIPKGDALLVGVLAGSASYIAAPAAMKTSLPEANPALYTTLPLAITFSFNVTLGIPFYLFLAGKLFSP